MKPRLLVATALAALTPLPAYAQGDRATVADTYDQGDWFWLDTTGTGPRGTLVLSNGEGVRKGDVVELKMFLAYRTPADSGMIGGRLIMIVDCKEQTQISQVLTIFYPGLRMRDIEPVTGDTEALPPSSVMYRFACTPDRSNVTHFGPSSRRGLSDSLFAKYPK